jgi:prophage antirepressor-like protein
MTQAKEIIKAATINVPNPPSNWEYGDKVWPFAYALKHNETWFIEKYLKPTNEAPKAVTVYFENEPQRIEVDCNGKEWWVAYDVCKSLGLNNTARAIKRVPKQHLTLSKVLAADGRIRKHWLVDEAGLNYLISGSESSKAKIYKEWVYATVLPTIRMTGSYSNSPMSTLDMIIAIAESQKQALSRIDSIEQRLGQYETRQRSVVASLDSVKEITPRAQIVKLVREYASNKKLEYRECFDQLYLQFKYRNHFDLKAIARNRNISPIEAAQQIGEIGSLLSLAVCLFVEEKN